MSFNYSESMIGSFKVCPRQAQFKYDLRLEKEADEKDEHHLKYGSAGHDSMKVLYKGGTIEEAKAAFTKGYPKQLDEKDEGKTQQNWFNLIEAYSKRNLLDDLARYKVLAVEEYDRFSFAEDDGFVVKLDLVMEDRQDGGIYGLDWKITGGSKAYLGQDNFWNQFNPNSQITKYIAYIKSKWGHCAGFYVHGFGMGYRSRMYKGEPAGTWFRQQRMEFNRTPDQVAAESYDTQDWIEKIEATKKKGYWPMNTSNCRFCEFQSICKAGWTWPDDQDLIRISFKERGLHSK